MPSGINLPDQGIAIKSRGRMGYYDAPTQLKMFVTGKHYQVAPFVFAPGGNDPNGEAERGVGMLAEVDVSRKGRTVVGMSVARGAQTTARDVRWARTHGSDSDRGGSSQSTISPIEPDRR